MWVVRDSDKVKWKVWGGTHNSPKLCHSASWGILMDLERHLKKKLDPAAESQPVLEISGLGNCSFSLLCSWAYQGGRKRRHISREASYFSSASLREEVCSSVPTLICYARQDQSGHGLTLSFTHAERCSSSPENAVFINKEI